MTTTENTRTVTVFGLVAAATASPEPAPAW
jgi:hypothetical protein